MDEKKETARTIQGRLEVLRKALVSEENSVEYYTTLLETSPGDTEENQGARRSYETLKGEEHKHVQVIKTLISNWEMELNKLRSG